jgi:uncharacterized membrane protein
VIEIIPNWHPICVHFTVGLLTAAVAFYILLYLFTHIEFLSKAITLELEIVARWCLWAGALVTVLTVLAGLYAFNTVKHDGHAHIAMMAHRNWALATAGIILLVVSWSVWRYYKGKTLSIQFIIALLIMQSFLLSTAWHGGELVYRHGLGVMSLPKDEAGEQHQHTAEEMGQSADHANMPSMENENSPHDH